MLLVLAAAAGQGMVSNAPPPPQAAVLSLESPNPRSIDATPRIVAVPRVPSFAEVPPVVVRPIRIRVAVGGQLLFDDVLRVSQYGGASYSESRNEAPPVTCPTVPNYGSSDRQSLNVQLYLREDQQTGPAVNVSVSWQRPSDAFACLGQGTRTVSLAETVPLQPGQPTTIRGDADLTVTVSAN